MLEWNIIQVAQYDQLVAKIPEVAGDDLAVAILEEEIESLNPRAVLPSLPIHQLLVIFGSTPPMALSDFVAYLCCVRGHEPRS